MQIENKTFLITGGVSGLGLATAQLIVSKGGNAVLADVNEAAGQQAQEELGAATLFLKTDVTDEENVKQTIANALAHFGALHGAINCAGIGPGERVLGRKGVHRLETFSKVIQINLIGTFNVLRLAAEAIQKNKPEASGERGIIINTASVAAYEGQIGQAAYSASKGGIIAMMLPIARELARFGIRVMTIAPGTFETPLLMGFSEEVKESLGQQVPFPSRLGKPEEYAQLAQQIIENQMLNGETIRLDGAIRMAAK
ncbi:3-hydroxyacyl-CoA dehydrogenase [Cytophaga sp. FL35]|uniref:3-hydroxyacyl-CoA dehydrogenase n=1 Tax=Cytophaga sp. FL35 TaxID=1904456 RepID=UPI001653B824|nr:3-hydroxyacyl-CoA dehydrogenase [Cytophaga sp. FL35]MBC6997312.1 3-hydroxyacyl-CoA dehydrogenase [Cytophaga sp. FL35]